jgi:hypothetical protein
LPHPPTNPGSNAFGGYFWSWVVFPACLVAICGAAVFIGAVPTRVFGHDIFFLLDNGWRIVNGQRPHVDFATPWGSVTFLVSGLGLVLSGYTVDGVGYGSALVGLLIGIWCFRLGRNRLESIPRVLISLYLVVLVVAPYPLGWGIFHTSHAMVPNRYGYALLGLVMVESFWTLGTKNRETEEWIGGISTGVAVALALFLKISYFFVAVLLIGTSFLYRGPSRRQLLGMFIGFSSVSTAFLTYLGFDIPAVLGDLKMAAGARSEGFSVYHLGLKFLINTPYLVLMGCLAVLGSYSENAAPTRRSTINSLLLAALVFAADMLLLFTNMQPTELPLSMIFCFFAANRAIVRHRVPADQEAHPARPAGRIVMVTGTIFFLVQFALGCSGLVYGVWMKANPSNLGSVERFTEPRLVPLILYDERSQPASNGRQYTTYVKEGIRLLRKNAGSDETVLTMDMINPFPYALGRRPALGGIAAAAYRYTLSDAHRPSDERFFGTADVVMVPKRPASLRFFFDGFYRIYEPALHDRFRLAAESDMWYLYKRK